MSFPVVVLISGSGSNLQALIDQSLSGALNINICAVISNKKEAFGLQRAQLAGIPTHVLNHKDYASRELFDLALKECIDVYQPKLVVLAGFMRILTADFTQHYQDRMLNIHPSLLPKFKGLDTHARAIAAGEEYHGVSVHFVSAELDAGAIIIQAKTQISIDETPETLAQKVHKLEHIIYPEAVKWFSEDRLVVKETGVWLDNTLLPENGFQYSS